MYPALCTVSIQRLESADVDPPPPNTFGPCCSTLFHRMVPQLLKLPHQFETPQSKPVRVAQKSFCLLFIIHLFPLLC